MTEATVKKPLVPWGWLRVLLFCMLYFSAFKLISVPVGTLIRLIQKGNENGKPTDIGDLMNGEFLWLTLMVGLVIALSLVFIFRKWIDRKSFMSLGFQTQDHGADAAAGFFLAPVILGTGSLILWLSHHLKWTDVNFNGADLFISFGIFVMVAISEEVVYRGYLLNNLMYSFNKWIALIISAMLFTVFHLAGGPMGFLPVVNIFLAGILLGTNYIYTKNLWFAIMFHLAWNFFQGPLLGFKVSGLTMQSLLQMELKGDLLLTGGDYGFEGSIIDVAITLAAIFCIYWVYEKKSKGKFSLNDL